MDGPHVDGVAWNATAQRLISGGQQMRLCARRAVGSAACRPGSLRSPDFG